MKSRWMRIVLFSCSDRAKSPSRERGRGRMCDDGHVIQLRTISIRKWLFIVSARSGLELLPTAELMINL